MNFASQAALAIAARGPRPPPLPTTLTARRNPSQRRGIPIGVPLLGDDGPGIGGDDNDAPNPEVNTTLHSSLISAANAQLAPSRVALRSIVSVVEPLAVELRALRTTPHARLNHRDASLLSARSLHMRASSSVVDEALWIGVLHWPASHSTRLTAGLTALRKGRDSVRALASAIKELNVVGLATPTASGTSIPQAPPMPAAIVRALSNALSAPNLLIALKAHTLADGVGCFLDVRLFTRLAIWADGAISNAIARAVRHVLPGWVGRLRAAAGLRRLDAATYLTQVRALAVSLAEAASAVKFARASRQAWVEARAKLNADDFLTLASLPSIAVSGEADASVWDGSGGRRVGEDNENGSDEDLHEFDDDEIAHNNGSDDDDASDFDDDDLDSRPFHIDQKNIRTLANADTSDALVAAFDAIEWGSDGVTARQSEEIRNFSEGLTDVLVPVLSAITRMDEITALSSLANAILTLQSSSLHTVLSAATPSGITLAFSAATRGHACLIRELFTAGLSPVHVYPCGSSILHFCGAAKSDDAAMKVLDVTLEALTSFVTRFTRLQELSLTSEEIERRSSSALYLDIKNNAAQTVSHVFARNPMRSLSTVARVLARLYRTGASISILDGTGKSALEYLAARILQVETSGCGGEHSLSDGRGGGGGQSGSGSGSGLSSFFGKSDFSDCTLIFDDGEGGVFSLPAHRIILAASSTFFAAAFAQDSSWSEGEGRREIRVGTLAGSSRTARRAIAFAYEGFLVGGVIDPLPPGDIDAALALLVAADALGMHLLGKLAGKGVERAMTRDNAVQVFNAVAHLASAEWLAMVAARNIISQRPHVGKDVILHVLDFIQ